MHNRTRAFFGARVGDSGSDHFSLPPQPQHVYQLLRLLLLASVGALASGAHSSRTADLLHAHTVLWILITSVEQVTPVKEAYTVTSN